MAERRRTQRRDLSVPIGRIHGIQIRVHLTFAFIVVLFAAGSTGPEGPGLVPGLGWLAVIFSCVLVHEFAHSLLAQSRGATVRSIVLLPIGGVSQLEHMPENWRDEAAIAAVGPATSFAIAGVAACAALLAGVDLLPPSMIGGGFLRGLVWFNLLVGAFNFLPAFPLDGGRVLRALLERTHNREAATRLAATMGRQLAIAMALVGLLWNVWLVVIAVFVYLGASAEERATVVHLRLSGLRVRDLMLLEPVTLHPDMTIAELTLLLRHTAQRQLPVVDTSSYVGMLDADAFPRGVSSEVRVGELMDRDAPPLAPDDPVEGEGSALELLMETRLKALAVVDAGRVVGLLAVEDLGHVVGNAA